MSMYEPFNSNIQMISLLSSQLYPGKMTHMCQKLCLVVYPVFEENLEPNGPQKKDGDGEDGKSSQMANWIA